MSVEQMTKVMYSLLTMLVLMLECACAILCHPYVVSKLYNSKTITYFYYAIFLYDAFAEIVLTARRCASAVYAMALCSSVSSHIAAAGFVFFLTLKI